LLRKPFPAQTIAIMGVAKRWQRARTGSMVVAECGTGKTLISLGAIHVRSEGRPFTALAMVPPHLVEKWALEWICENWQLPDAGIWEMRNRQEHFVYSKA
jgi:superfamily II DNA or RNA helicase